MIVFTSSDELVDINRAYDLGVNSYIIKPGDFGDLQKLLRELEQYWLTLNTCPDCGANPSQRARPAQVLIRNLQTGLFYQGANRWTRETRLALNFERSERALQTVRALKLNQPEIIIELAGEHFSLQRAGGISGDSVSFVG